MECNVKAVLINKVAVSRGVVLVNRIHLKPHTAAPAPKTPMFSQHLIKRIQTILVQQLSAQFSQ